MIVTLIIISLAFIWLGYESDWLRVELCYCEHGACCQWRMPDDAVTRDMKGQLIEDWQLNRYKRDKILGALLGNGHSPLCGWGYAYQYRNFSPEYSIELIGAGYKTTLRSNNSVALRDAFKVNRNPYIRVKV